MSIIKNRCIFNISLGFLLLSGTLFFHADILAMDQFGSSGPKNISYYEGGLMYEITTDANDVEGFLNEKNIKLKEFDVVYPDKKERIYNGSNIIVQRSKKITIKENGTSKEIQTLRNTVEQAVWDVKDIKLGDDDITSPSRDALLKGNDVITVTHVVIKEEDLEESVPFKTVVNEDDQLGWRIKKTTQKGINGIKQVKSRVVYHNDKEISRKVLEKTLTRQPTDEIVTQGTYIKIGKTHTGAASWYAYTGTLSAANPWLPMGSYVRVTNQDNGKSVIVKINDRGPFGNGRIIDLDKVAFEKIASLGAGVANVKMEVITN